MKNSKENSIFLRLLSNAKAALYIFNAEFKNVFKDRGVLLVIIIAPLVYPFIYSYIYKNETAINVPIAVVDHSNTERSKEFVRNLDATMDVAVVAKLNNLENAKTELYKGNIHGIIYIPSDFSKNIATRDQAHISMYSDMSSFMYYRALVLAVNYTSLDMNKRIEIERLNDDGVVGEQALVTAKPIENKGNILYNPGMGFGSFLLPALLILIIHQTLVFGIGMAGGVERETNPNGELITTNTSRGGLYRVVFGRATAYFVLYLFWSVIVLMVVPKIFNLPHIGHISSILSVVIPFLLATIFFAMTLGYFNMEREVQMVMIVFFSVILVFLSGISWPQSAFGWFWKAFSYIFPSTFGVQGYIKANSMGAEVGELKFETIGLWIQTLIYFITTSILYYRELKRKENLLL